MFVPIRELHITSFRGIREASVRLHPRVTVFFGANAAGKTTVLDVLAIALGAVVRRVPKSQGRDFAKSGDIRVAWHRQPLLVGDDEVAGVEAPFARVQVLGADGTSWDVTRYRSKQDHGRAPEGFGISMLRDAIDPLVIDALDAAPGMPTRPIPLLAAYGNERAVVDIPLRERDFAKNFERLAGLDKALTATTRFKAVFEWFRVMEDEERRGKEHHRDFDYRLPALEWVRRAVAKAELRCANPRVETRPLRMLVDFEHDGGELQALDIKSLSDGYRTHFALVVDIARRMVQLNPSDNLDDPERGTNCPGVVIIDEIDLHLDPQWQGRVVQGLMAAFPNTQLVVSTHSEQVIASVEAECVRRLVWREGQIVVEEVPFAQGASGERILVDLMGAPERVEGPVRDTLRRYLQLVQEGQYANEEARRLRLELEAALPGDPALHRADLENQRQELMARLRRRGKA